MPLFVLPLPRSQDKKDYAQTTPVLDRNRVPGQDHPPGSYNSVIVHHDPYRRREQVTGPDTGSPRDWALSRRVRDDRTPTPVPGGLVVPGRRREGRLRCG